MMNSKKKQYFKIIKSLERALFRVLKKSIDFPISKAPRWGLTEEYGIWFVPLALSSSLCSSGSRFIRSLLPPLSLYLTF